MSSRVHEVKGVYAGGEGKYWIRLHELADKVSIVLSSDTYRSANCTITSDAAKKLAGQLLAMALKIEAAQK